jgi:hydrogenase nickel incorporation protein HypA/HybF
MHETSVVKSLIELIEEHLAEQGHVRVKTVRLRMGPLAGVVREELTFAFYAAIAGTDMEGARLEFESAPLEVWCRTCMALRTLASPQQIRCPVCLRPTPDVLGGRELELSWLEVVDISEVTHAT